MYSLDLYVLVNQTCVVAEFCLFRSRLGGLTYVRVFESCKEVYRPYGCLDGTCLLNKGGELELVSS